MSRAPSTASSRAGSRPPPRLSPAAADRRLGRAARSRSGSRPGSCPGVALGGRRRGVRRRRPDRDPERGRAAAPGGAAAAVHARRRVPARPGRRRADAAARARLLADDIRVDSFGDALLASLVIAAVTVVLDVILGTNDDDAYTLRVTRRVAARQGVKARTDAPGDPLPRDRRARAAGAARRDARRQRADHGALGRRGRLPAGRVGDRPLLADRRQPGGDPARLQRRHPRLPLGREGERPDDGLLLARRLRRDRAPPRHRRRPARRRRREPRQPAQRARRTRRSSPSAGPTTSAARTPATGRSSPTASTSRGRWCCSSGRSILE